MYQVSRMQMDKKNQINLKYFVTNLILTRSNYEWQLSNSDNRKKIMKKLLLTLMIGFGAVNAEAYSYGSIYSNTIGNTTFHSGSIGGSSINITTNRIGNYSSSIGSIGSSSINIGTNRIGNYSSSHGSIGNNSLSIGTSRYGSSSTSLGSIGSRSIYGNSFSYGQNTTSSWILD